MIHRYTLPEMGAIWTEENKFRKWLEVESQPARRLRLQHFTCRREDAPVGRDKPCPYILDAKAALPTT